MLKSTANCDVVTSMNGDLAVIEVQKNMHEFYEFDVTMEGHSLKEQPRHFDAIIMDLNMPIMDGYKACKKILQIYKEYNEK